MDEIFSDHDNGLQHQYCSEAVRSTTLRVIFFLGKVKATKRNERMNEPACLLDHSASAAAAAPPLAPPKRDPNYTERYSRREFSPSHPPRCWPLASPSFAPRRVKLRRGSSHWPG